MTQKPTIQKESKGGYTFSHNEQIWGPFDTELEAIKTRDYAFPPTVESDHDTLHDINTVPEEEQETSVYLQQLTILQKQINWTDKTLAFLLADELSKDDEGKELAGEIATFMARVMKFMEVE